MSKIGFIGLGIMGVPMAGHLIAGGHALFLYGRRPPKEGADVSPRTAVKPASVKQEPEREAFAYV
jgi:2-hydroxy-3-oxopropionate reductase